MQAMTERFELRVDQSILERIDAWRGNQDDLPSRSEAVRRLIENGLGLSGGQHVHFRESDKLIVSMLCDISRQLKVKDGLDPDFVADALYGGHYWGLEWQYTGLFRGHEDSRASVREVVDILDMWSFMESAYLRLSKEDRERIKVEADPLGGGIEFPGFDGNNETEHLGIARFMIDKMRRFESFKGRELNSHCPLLPSYRRMFGIFEHIRPTLVGRELTANEIIELLKARMHPESRRAQKSAQKSQQN